MENGITIARLKSVKELEQCAGMYSAAYNAEPWNDNWNNETALALLTCYYNTPEFIGWIARRNGMITGCAIGNLEPYYSGNIFILKEVFVCVDSQRTSTGSSLMTVMKAHLEEINVKMILLSTRRPVFDFYIKAGFKEMDGVGTMIYSYKST